MGLLTEMRFWKHTARDTSGAEIAEAAIVLPLVFMLLLGIYWFGRAYNIYATITHAAREGARAATAPACALCGNAALTPDQVAARVSGCPASLQAKSESSHSIAAKSGAEGLHHQGARSYLRRHRRRKSTDLLPDQRPDQRSDYGASVVRGFGQLPIPLPVLSPVHIVEQPTDSA